MRDSVMIGRVKIPSDVPRDEYVIYALRTRTACVELEGGDFLRDCPVVYSFCGFNDGFIHSLDFPPDSSGDNSVDKTQKRLGSQVVLLSVPYAEKPLIIGCLGQHNSTLSLEEEKQLKLYRTSDTGSFLIEGSGLSGLIKMIVTSTTTEGGKIDISTLNEFKTGEIKLSTNNYIIEGTESIQLTTEKLFQVLIRNLDTNNGGKSEFTTIKYEYGVGFSFEDEFGNKITTLETGIEFGEGKQPAVLGDTLVELMEELSDILASAKTATSLGAQPFLPDTQAKIASFKDKLDTMKSKLVTLD